MSSSLVSVRVAALRSAADGIVSVELRALDGADLPAFEAGAHLDLHLPNGIVRSYSLSNSPRERQRYVLGVLNDRASRGGSRYVHEQLQAGATLQVSAPRNHFPLDLSAPHTVLIAGGIGITPLYCMFHHLRSLCRSVELLYCARTRGEAAFCDELLALEGVQLHVDQEQGGPPDLRAYLAGKAAGAHFYCCGPAPMLNAFEQLCQQLGLPNVHIERFSAAGPVAPAQDSGYVAFLARTEQSVTVPAGRSLLDALLDAGVDVDNNCRDGVCGACETRVIEGTPDHRDSFLSKGEHAANKSMIVCVSGCKGARLVLDL
jgi:vanillate O-demethylase ferredoxin subunit